MITHKQAEDQINLIEAEMKSLGWWRRQPPPPDAFDFRLAFAMDTMTFTSWLQFVFIPKVRQIIENRGAFPTSSQVGTQAIREFDGISEAERLTALLNDFDAMINGQMRSEN